MSGRLALVVLAGSVLGILAGGTASSPPAACAAVMNAYCNGPQMGSCNAKIARLNGTLPTVALDDEGRGGGTPAWRCYSPSCLEMGPGGWVYKRGSGCSLYCTQPKLLKVLEQCLHPQPTPPPHAPPEGHEIRVNATDIWGPLAARCGQIRTPELILTPSNMVLIGQCRVAPKPPSVVAPGPAGDGKIGGDASTPPLRDDMRDVMLVQVVSTDNGTSWGAPKFISEVGRSVGVGVYDRDRDTIVLQFQSFLSSNPYAGNTLWQRVSHDRGASWGTCTASTRTCRRLRSVSIYIFWLAAHPGWMRHRCMPIIDLVTGAVSHPLVSHIPPPLPRPYSTCLPDFIHRPRAQHHRGHCGLQPGQWRAGVRRRGIAAAELDRAHRVLRPQRQRRRGVRVVL